MKKKIIVFVAAVFVFIMAATQKWGDSGHALALITVKGGKCRHPVYLSNTHGLYSVIITARVLSHYQGNVKIILERASDISHNIYFSEPVIDLGFKKLPEFKNNTLYGLKAGHKIALWLVMRPKNDICKQSVYPKGKYTLAFYDTKTNNSVLKVPIFLRSKIEEKNEHRQHNH